MMRTDLDHLPEAKRRELAEIVRILFEEFEAATAKRGHTHRRNGQILKVILFGSHARGDWVADPDGGYFSDYDLLVVVDHEDLTDTLEYWAKADDRLMREVTIAKRISAPVNFIVHTLFDVNKRLKKGRPFFIDIVRDGVALYEAPGHPFDHPEPLSPSEALIEARGYFEEWFTSAQEYVDDFQSNKDRGRNKKAAFEAHQAVERLYHCLLLVLTLYSPKSHKLNFLRSHAERLAPELGAVWPRETKFQQRCFELLRRAYVDARYSPHYKVSPEELSWLQERIAVLEQQVRAACDAELVRLESSR